MSTATLSAQEQENARINAENERLRKQATRKRRIGLGFSYFALNAITQTWPPKLVPNQFTLETTSRCSNVCQSVEKCSIPSSSPVP